LFENEVGEVQIRIGNSVSSGALAICAFWGIDVLILTQRGNPVAVLKSLGKAQACPLVDDFIIQYAKNLRRKDFSMKQEDFSSNRKGQREYLTKGLAKDLLLKLNCFFESKVEIPLGKI